VTSAEWRAVKEGYIIKNIARFESIESRCRTNRGMTWPRPGVDESILARRQEAVLAKDQRRQPLVGDLLAYQRLQQWALIKTGAGRSSDKLHGIEAADTGARARCRSRRMGGCGQ